MSADIAVRLDLDLANALVASVDPSRWHLAPPPSSTDISTAAESVVISASAGGDSTQVVVLSLQYLAAFVGALCDLVRRNRPTSKLRVTLTQGHKRADLEVDAVVSTLLPVLTLWFEISESENVADYRAPSM